MLKSCTTGQPPSTGSAGAIAPNAILFADPRQAVRDRAGLTLEAAARKARVSVGYLRSVERGNGCSFPLAQRLASLYGCRCDLFLATKPKVGAPMSRRIARA